MAHRLGKLHSIVSWLQGRVASQNRNSLQQSRRGRRQESSKAVAAATDPLCFIRVTCPFRDATRAQGGAHYPRNNTLLNSSITHLVLASQILAQRTPG